MFRRICAAVALSAAVVVAAPSVASADTAAPLPLAPNSPGACATNIIPGDIPVSYGTGFDVKKTMTRSDDGKGNATLTVKITSAAGSTLTLDTLKDCVWADTNANSKYDAGESLSLFQGSGAMVNGVATFTVTVPSTARLCDRVWGSFLWNGAPAYKLSDVACMDAPPPPVVPESKWVALLGVSAIAVVGGFMFMRRRRLVVG